MLSLTILLAAGIIAAVFLLSFATIQNWFKNQYKLRPKQAEEYRVIVRGRLKSGNFKEIAGVFNDRTGEIIADAAWKAEKLDKRLAAMDQVAVLSDYD